MDSLEKVQGFIQEYWGIKKKSRLTPETSLSDLGFYGDDKYEFMYSFFKRFDINPENFEPYKYVEPEPPNPIGFIIAWFSKKQDTIKEITIDNLVTALEKRMWID